MAATTWWPSASVSRWSLSQERVNFIDRLLRRMTDRRNASPTSICRGRTCLPGDNPRARPSSRRSPRPLRRRIGRPSSTCRPDHRRCDSCRRRQRAGLRASRWPAPALPASSPDASRSPLFRPPWQSASAGRAAPSGARRAQLGHQLRPGGRVRRGERAEAVVLQPAAVGGEHVAQVGHAVFQHPQPVDAACRRRSPATRRDRGRRCAARWGGPSRSPGSPASRCPGRS